MSSWSIVFPFNPIATPRPSFTVRKGGIITYYKPEYSAYLAALQSYIDSQGMYNERLKEVVNSKYGVVANIIFYIGVPKSINRVTKLTYTSKPDIDNLVKALIDGIFNKLKAKDSRVVGIKVLKLKTLSNPRTEVTLTGLTDIRDQNNSETNYKVNSLFNNAENTSSMSWKAVIPFNPIATPRPAITFRKAGIGSDGKPKYEKHTYNSTKYEKYLADVNKYLVDNDLYNDLLKEAVSAEYGLIANFNFFCKTPKNQKAIRKILKTTAPDIDNLVKAAMDSVFNNISADDSRVIGVQALKFNEIDNPRTEMSFTGLTRLING